MIVSPVSRSEVHCDSLHMKKTSICESLLRAAVPFGYGSVAVGSSEAFSMHNSIDTASPIRIEFGSHGW